MVPRARQTSVNELLDAAYELVLRRPPDEESGVRDEMQGTGASAVLCAEHSPR
jgi:hypothetical protein